MKLKDFIAGIFLLLLILLAAAELVFPEPYIVQGQIVDVEHVPATNASSISVGVGADNPSPLVVHTDTQGRETWRLVLLVDGKIKVFDVSPEVYYSVEKGEYVELTCRRGRVLGSGSCFSATTR